MDDVLGNNLISLVLFLSAICIRIWLEIYPSPAIDSQLLARLYLPFTLRWRLRLPQFYLLDESSPPPASEDKCEHHRLCETCRRLVRESSLILGSCWLLTPMCEWHEMWPFFRELEDSASRHCHLCSLFMGAVSEVNRKAMAGQDSFRLKVKVWQERPVGSYINMRLIWNEKQVSQTLRIVKHNHTAVEQIGDTEFITSSLNTGSDVHIRQIDQWITRCIHRHLGSCQTTSDRDLELPTRLLRLSRIDGRDSFHLYTPAGLENIRYAALSHCWGEATNGPIFTLNKETWKAMIEGMSINELPESFPKNFRHAIDICFRLGLSYLWIDSLCIQQDSKADWVREAARMGDVYAGAHITIAATGAMSGSVGCYRQRNPLSLYSCRIAGTSQRGMYVSPVDCGIEIAAEDSKEWRKFREQSSFEQGVVNSPLNKRAWVFQERLLSQRVVHFGSDRLYWECQALTASETYPEGFQYEEHQFERRNGQRPLNVPEIMRVERWNQTGRVMDIERQVLEDQRPEPLDPVTEPRMYERRLARMFTPTHVAPEWPADSSPHAETAKAGLRGAFDTLRLELPHGTDEDLVQKVREHQRWYDLVSTYTNGNLTYETDKLVALSGISKEIQRARGMTYLAGLWRAGWGKEDIFLLNLLWFVEDWPGRRTQQYIAPTWSWASLKIGRVNHDITAHVEGSVEGMGFVGSSAVLKCAEVYSGEDLVAVDEQVHRPGFIVLEAAICEVSLGGAESKEHHLYDQSRNCVGKMIPDTLIDQSHAEKGLFCMPIIHLQKKPDPRAREPFRTTASASTAPDEYSVQGLVLRPCPSVSETFERVGFFTTKGLTFPSPAYDPFRGCIWRSVKIV